MTRWGLLVEITVQGNQPTLMETQEEMDGTREEAEARLQELIRGYQPRHPMNPKRRRLYRTADGWMLIGDGAFGRAYPYHFRVCELIWDTAAK